MNRPAWPTSGSGSRRPKQVTAALQAEMVPTQLTVVGVADRASLHHAADRLGSIRIQSARIARQRSVAACARAAEVFWPAGVHYSATFRSLFGDVPVRVRRLLACPCQGSGEAKRFAVLNLEAATVAPELAYYSLRVSSAASPVELERSVEDAESPRRCGDSVTL